MFDDGQMLWTRALTLSALNALARFGVVARRPSEGHFCRREVIVDELSVHRVKERRYGNLDRAARHAITAGRTRNLLNF